MKSTTIPMASRNGFSRKGQPISGLHQSINASEKKDTGFSSMKILFRISIIFFGLACSGGNVIAFGETFENEKAHEKIKKSNLFICSVSDPSVANGYTCGPGNAQLSAAPSGGAGGDAIVKGASPQVGGGGGGNPTYTVYWFATASGSNSNYLVTGTGYDPYVTVTTTFYASVYSSSGCWSNRVPVTATVYTPPGSNAGSNVTLCTLSGSTGLAANNPSPATGTWTVASGPSTSSSQFSSTSAYNATFTPAGGAGNYVLTWTVRDSHCGSASSLTVSVQAAPTVANAGPSQQGASTCGLVVATMAANTPTVGTGLWSIVSDSPGQDGHFANPSSPNTTFRGTAGQTYIIDWTITNGACTSVSEINVIFNINPTTAAAGSNQTICASSSATLAANTPSVGTGAWTVASGPSTSTTQFSSTVNPTATFTPSGGCGTYVLTWTISNSPCSASSSNVTITVPPQPINTTLNNLVYGSGSVQLSAQAGQSGDNLNWYSVASGGSSIGTSATYPTPTLTSTTTYYVAETNPATGCVSPRTAIKAYVVPLIVAPVTVREEIIRMSGITQDSQIAGLTTTQKTTRTSFLDGLNRTAQVQMLKASPAGNDIVQQFVYDQFGRTSKDYLPYTATTTNGAYSQSFAVDQPAFYNNSSDKVADDVSPYAVANYEASPLGRVTEQGGVGAAWQTGGGHSTKAVYSFNAINEVRQFNSDGTNTFYAKNILDRTQVTDENGNNTVTYSHAGKTILRKQQINEVIDGVAVDYLETYYIYDDFGRVIDIIQPKGTAALKLNNSWNLSQTIKDQYVFEFVYDKRGRLTQKKVPGAGWTYIVYDQLNRPVLIQDNNTRGNNQWLFVKYDALGRSIMNGLYTDNTHTTLASMQGVLDAMNYDKTSPDLYYEVRQASTTHGYSNQAFPTTSTTILNVNYYDDYDFNYDGTADYSYQVQGLTNEETPADAYAMATGSKRLILGTATSTCLWTSVFYDKYGRSIQTQSNNHLNTAMTNVSTVVYDFEGKATITKTHHDAGGTNQTTVTTRPVYDFAGRTLQIFHQTNSNSEVMAAQYQYNELGQVVDKAVHSTNGGTSFLQSVDYRYNIKGWLTSINNAQLNVDSRNDDANDYFGMEFLYNTTESGLNNQTGDKTYFDGNVSAIKWNGPNASVTSGQRSYKFRFDKAGRLDSALFQAYGTTGWNAEVNTLNEVASYDHNGNIYSLLRNSKTATGLQAIDNLTYTYASGNLLSKVTDASADTLGFRDGANLTTEYTYDNAGNLTYDANKGIDSVKYNFMGKVTRIRFHDGHCQTYWYDAGGNKLETKTYSKTGVLQTTTDYVGGFVYQDNALNFFSSPEGRVVNNAGKMEYQYAIADHQGNTRLVFTSGSVAESVTATFESANQTTESAQFGDYPSGNGIKSLGMYNHTPGGSNSQWLGGYPSSGTNGLVGVSKSYKVFPGDTVKIEAYGSHNTPGSNSSNLTGFAAALLSAFNLPAPGNGETGTASAAINAWGALAAAGEGDSGDGTDPKAFVTILVFDRNYNLLDAAFSQLKGSTQAYVAASYPVTQAGYAFLYVSNEQPTLTDVYFDDVKMTHTSKIIQYNEYYPFGMQSAESYTKANSTNNFLYDQGGELNTTSGWYDLSFRNYDPALGRFHQVDPMATSFHNLSPYNYAGNNPAMINDPGGDRMDGDGIGETVEVQDPDGEVEYVNWADDSGGGGGGSESVMTEDDDQESENIFDLNDIEDGDKDGKGDKDGGVLPEVIVTASRIKDPTPAQPASPGYYDDWSFWSNPMSIVVGTFQQVSEMAIKARPSYISPSEWKVALKGGKALSKVLGVVGLLITTADYAISENVSSSHILDAAFGIIDLLPGIGSLVGGGYFVVNSIVIMSSGGTSIGDILDNYLDNLAKEQIVKEFGAN
jgi:RHS repeat-associated protein